MKSYSKRTALAAFSLLLSILVFAGAVSAFAAPLAEKASVIRAAYVGTVSQSMFMANLEFPADAKLPIDAEVAVPRGAVISWFGEIMGSDPSQDKTLSYKKVETRGSFDIYRVTIVNSRIIQVEAGVGMPVEEVGGSTKLTVTYAPAQAADELILAAELPKTAEVDLADGISPIAEGGAGGQVYGTTKANVKAGEEHSIAMTYQVVSTTKKAVNDTLGGKLPMQTVILIVMAIAAIALVIGLLVVGGNRKPKTSQDDNLEEDGDYSYTLDSDENDASEDQDSMGNFDFEDDEDTEEEAAVVQVVATKNSRRNDVAKPEVAKEKMNTKQKLVLITTVVALLGVAAIVAAGLFTDRPTVSNGVYSQLFAQGDPCADATFSLTEEALSNPDNAAKTLFSLLKKSSVPVLTGKLDTNTKTLTVGYCESQTNGQEVEALLKGSTLVGASNIAPNNVVIPNEDGTAFSYNFVETGPCVVSEVAFEAAPNEDPVAAAQAIAQAVKDVPSITAFNYYPETKTAHIGYCDEQATDEVILEALNKAGLKSTLKTPAQSLAPAE